LEVFHHSRWNPAGTGEDIWLRFAQDGSLPNYEDETPAADGEQLGAALAVRFTLQPGETRSIPFVLAWDFPVTEFAAGVQYYRRYTDFFGRTGNNAWSVARTAFKHNELWKEKIQAWQEPILNRGDLPNWFKMALFNELYLLADGGTLWSAADDRDPVGQFAVLECIDYRWYESLDVRLYGSFALMMLWPRLDKAVLEAFARAIPTSDETPRIIGYNKATAIRKAANATPHDLGAPNEHPWEKTNYTSYQDCNQWKDLPCDFVLQVYRDFVLTGANDVEFLWECWSAIVKTLSYLKAFDQDGDGIPENSGAPDQTFDDWQLKGISAYCGGLWLAALEAAIAIGEILIDNYPPVSQLIEAPLPESIQETIDLYRNWLKQARPLYQEKLWNGQYYRLDSESGSDIVMADQLCGQFYARLLGLPDIVPIECAQSALKSVYESCFLKFQDAQIGAANGVRPDGSPENPNSTHPLEVWTGINFGLAAFLMQLEMKEEALRLTEAVVRTVYENGLQFRTPEAITATGTFRASHYLRAMAIWAIYLTIRD
jgi:non-lysosomal glucosylceramidase